MQNNKLQAKYYPAVCPTKIELGVGHVFNYPCFLASPIELT